MFRILLTTVVLCGLGLSGAFAGPGFDDYFWGEPIAVLDNDPAGLGIPTQDLYVTGTDGDVLAERMFYANIPSTVIQNWQANPDQNFGLAIIGRGPDYLTNNCWATHAMTWKWAARPRLKMDGWWSYADSSAWIKQHDPDFMMVGGDPQAAATNNSQFCLGDGRNVVLYRWSGDPGAGSALTGTVPGEFRTFSVGAPHWVDEAATFDVYVAPAAWDPSYITYDYYVQDPCEPWPFPWTPIDDRALSILLSHWAQTGVAWEDGDLDQNDIVDDRDLSILLGTWAQYDGCDPWPGLDDATVPEPASLALLALGGLALRRR